MNRLPSISAFFPAYNEEANVGAMVERLGAVLPQVADDYEIIVVNDGSQDRTAEVADKLAAADPCVRVIHHPQNRKLGGCLKTGFAEARGELVLYTDADLPFDMDEARKAVRLLRLYDAHIVSAFRFDRTGEGFRRAVYSYLYNHLVRMLLGLRLRDVNFACKLVHRDVLDHLELKSEGSFIDVELLARAQRLGFQIVQFGVDYFPRTRGISTLSSNAVILHIVKEMLMLNRELGAIQPLPDDVLHPGTGDR